MPRSDYDDRQRDPYGRFARDRDDDRGYHGRGRMMGVGGGVDRDRERDRDFRGAGHDDDRDRFSARTTGRDRDDYGRYEQRVDRDRDEYSGGGGYGGGEEYGGGGRRFEREDDDWRGGGGYSTRGSERARSWEDDEDRSRFRSGSYDRERDEYGRFTSDRGERGDGMRPLSGRDREDYGMRQPRWIEEDDRRGMSRGRPLGRERDEYGRFASNDDDRTGGMVGRGGPPRSRSRSGRDDDERPAGNQPGHPFYGNQYSRGRHNSRYDR